MIKKLKKIKKKKKHTHTQLVHTQNQIKLMHSIMQYTLSMFLHNIKHVLCQERDIIIHVILKKNKAKHKIKYFFLFENIQYFWIFE